MHYASTYNYVVLYLQSEYLTEKKSFPSDEEQVIFTGSWKFSRLNY